jgi:hypothetical protein
MAIGGICLTKEYKAATLQPRLALANFKPKLQRGIFKSIL